MSDSINPQLRIRTHPGTLRFLAHSTLTELTPKLLKERQAEALVETIQRAWLFSGGAEPFAELPRFRELWQHGGLFNDCRFSDDLVSALDDWLDKQRSARTYEAPDSWDSHAPPVLKRLLPDLLHKWCEADGTIVFVRRGNDPDILPAVLLPFILQEGNADEHSLASAQGGAPTGIDLHDSVIAANQQARRKGWIESTEQQCIRLHTLPGATDIRIGGPSGGLPVLIALWLRHRKLRVPALRLAASGALNDVGALDPFTDAEQYQAKWKLLSAVGIPKIVLPQPMPGGWPCGEDLTPQLDELAQEFREFSRSKKILVPCAPGCWGVIETNSDGVKAICITTDGQVAVSGHADGRLRAWDPESGDPLSETESFPSEIVAVSLCGRDVWALHGNGSVTVWNLDSKERTPLPALFVSPWEQKSLSVRSDGMLALVGRGGLFGARRPLVRWGGVRIDNSGRIIKTPKKETKMRTGDWSGVLGLWDRTRNCVSQLTGHDDGVCAVDMTPDGRIGVSIGGSGTVHVWDLEKKVLAHRPLPGHTACATCLAITPDGRWAISGGHDKMVRLWDLVHHKCVRSFEGHGDTVTCVRITPDGTRAVSGSVDGSLRLWDLKREKELHVFEGHDGTIHDVCMTTDGRRSISCGANGNLRIWDLTAGFSCCGKEALEEKEVSVWPQHGWSHQPVRIELKHARGDYWPEATASVISLDRRRILTAHEDATIRVWHTDTAKCLMILRGHARRVPCRGHERQVRSIAISPDGRFAVSGGSDKTVRVWDLSGGQCLHVLKGHGKSVRCVAISPDGQRILSGDRDGTLREWESESGRCTRVMELPSAMFEYVCYTCDGRSAVSWDDCAVGPRVAFWDLTTGNCLGEDSPLEPPEPHGLWTAQADHQIFINQGDGIGVCDFKTKQYRDVIREIEEGPVTCGVITSDGTQAVFGSEEGTLQAVDLVSEKVLWTRSAHGQQIHSVCLDPDEKIVFSVGFDKHIGVWDIASGESIQQLPFHVHSETLLIADRAGFSFAGHRFRWNSSSK